MFLMLLGTVILLSCHRCSFTKGAFPRVHTHSARLCVSHLALSSTTHLADNYYLCVRTKPWPELIHH